MFRKLVVVTCLFVLVLLIGCAAHIHTVGNGPQGVEETTQRQWYALWGLIPINEVDTKALAAGATDYEIKTERSAVDIILNIFTNYVTIVSRTVTVTK